MKPSEGVSVEVNEACHIMNDLCHIWMRYVGVCVYVHVCACVYTYMCVCVCMYVCVCICTCTFVCVRVYEHLIKSQGGYMKKKKQMTIKKLL